RLRGRRRRYSGKIDFIDQKRLVCRQGVERLDGIENGLRGAEVGGQRVALVAGLARGGQIGVDVAATKAVNGLLRIADEQQRAVRTRRIEIDPAQAGVLQRIGILELVHLRIRPALVMRISTRRPRYMSSKLCTLIQASVI